MIAFLDDDAYVHDGWIANILSSFGPGVGAVGGRALIAHGDAGAAGPDSIGRLTEDGALTGFFDADPGQAIGVDHVLGCNMAFSADVLALLGGLRDDYKGTAVREESDLCVRVKHLGHRIIFNLSAVVTHVGAKQAREQRFDLRYMYYAQRNHCLFLVRNFGFTSSIVRRFLRQSAREAAETFIASCSRRRYLPGVARLSTNVWATAIGTVFGIAALLHFGTDPIRRDPTGSRIAWALRQTVSEAGAMSRTES